MLRRSYKRRLIDQEVLVKCMHQHWRVIALPLIYSILLAAPPLLLFLTLPDGTWSRVLVGLASIACLGAWCWFAMPSLLQWYGVSYAVTSRRVLFREGVIRRHYEQVDLVGVSNPMLDKSGWDLVFFTGTIDLGGGRQMTLVPRAVKVERLVSQLAANQTKDIAELTRLLRNMGYSRLTTK